MSDATNTRPSTPYERGETVWPDYPPKRFWWDAPWRLYQWPLSRPVYFSGDEHWRRTLAIHLPLLGRLVIAVSKPGYFDPATGEPCLGCALPRNEDHTKETP